MMPSGEVIRIVGLLERQGLSVWLDGGWGVDALAGRQTRPHDDLDVAILPSNSPTTITASTTSTGATTWRAFACCAARAPASHSTVSVFTLGRDGSPRHSYTARPYLSDDIDQRGIDLLTPAWHVLDLTPQGRGDWYAQLDYGR